MMLYTINCWSLTEGSFWLVGFAESSMFAVPLMITRTYSLVTLHRSSHCWCPVSLI